MGEAEQLGVIFFFWRGTKAAEAVGAVFLELALSLSLGFLIYVAGWSPSGSRSLPQW